MGQKRERTLPRRGRNPTEAADKGHQGPARPWGGEYLEFILFFFLIRKFIFLAMPYGIWDLSSLTRD